MKDINVNKLIDEMGSPDFEYIDGNISLPSKERKEEPKPDELETKEEEPQNESITETNIEAQTEDETSDNGESESIFPAEEENNDSNEPVEELKEIVEDIAEPEKEIEEEQPQISEPEPIEEPKIVVPEPEEVVEEVKASSPEPEPVIEQNTEGEKAKTGSDKSSEEIVNEFVSYMGDKHANKDIESSYNPDLLVLQRLFGLNSLDMQILDLIQNYQSTEENIDIHHYVRGFINFILGR